MRIAQDALLQQRMVTLTGPITEESATKAALEIMALTLTDAKTPVTVLLSSAGGSPVHALALCDVMRAVETPIQTIVLGWALSAATTIAACGTRGMRLAFPSSRYLLHQIREDIQDARNVILKDHKAWVGLQESVQRRVFTVLAEATGKTVREVTQAAEWDRYLGARDAVEFGLADALCERVARPVRKGRR